MLLGVVVVVVYDRIAQVQETILEMILLQFLGIAWTLQQFKCCLLSDPENEMPEMPVGIRTMRCSPYGAWCIMTVPSLCKGAVQGQSVIRDAQYID